MEKKRAMAKRCSLTGQSSKALGMAKSLLRGRFSIPMARFTKASSKTGCLKGQERRHGPMVANTRVSGLEASQRAKVSKPTQMDDASEEGGRTETSFLSGRISRAQLSFLRKVMTNGRRHFIKFTSTIKASAPTRTAPSTKGGYKMEFHMAQA